MTSPLPAPKAFLGYVAMQPSGRVLVRVCSWCADARQANAEALAAGQDITHGLCASCLQSQLGELLETK